MAMTTIYGIKNCDTMKKAFGWLEQNNISYDFHDYKKQGTPKEVIQQALSEHGWQNVINKRGTTWRNLPENVKSEITQESALDLAENNPSIVKRPLLIHKGQSYLGFKPEIYEGIFNA